MVLLEDLMSGIDNRLDQFSLGMGTALIFIGRVRYMTSFRVPSKYTVDCEFGGTICIKINLSGGLQGTYTAKVYMHELDETASVYNARENCQDTVPIPEDIRKQGGIHKIKLSPQNIATLLSSLNIETLFDESKCSIENLYPTTLIAQYYQPNDLPMIKLGEYQIGSPDKKDNLAILTYDLNFPWVNKPRLKEQIFLMESVYYQTDFLKYLIADQSDSFIGIIDKNDLEKMTRNCQNVAYISVYRDTELVYASAKKVIGNMSNYKFDTFEIVGDWDRIPDACIRTLSNLHTKMKLILSDGKYFGSIARDVCSSVGNDYIVTITYAGTGIEGLTYINTYNMLNEMIESIK